VTRQALGLRVVLPLAITLLAWHPLPLAPAPGLDPSWHAGLAMAIHDRLTFGADVVWNYGPFGFLHTPTLWFTGLGEAGVVYNLLLRLVLAAATFGAARRSFALPVAFVIALLVSTVDDALREPVLVLIASVWVLTARLSRREALLTCAGLGAFAGLQLLNKVSIGLTILVMAAILVVSLPERRRECAVAGGAALCAAFLVSWGVLGQDFGAIWQFVLNSADIAFGFAGGLSVDKPGLVWIYPAGFIALGLGTWAALHTTTDAAGRARRGVVLLWIAFWFFAFKEGSVRLDSPHASVFFDALLGGFVAFRWRGRQRYAALAGVLTLLAFALVAQGRSFTNELDPVRNVRAAVDDLSTAASPSKRAATIARGRDAIRAAEPIDPDSLRLLQGQTVATFPSEIAVAWAYGLDWRPLPVLQAYSAYTSGLDRLDAEFVSSPRAAERIVFQPSPGLDGRLPAFDQPRTNREILCRYRLMRRTASLAVLGLSANRCSRESPLRTVHARLGESVTVPTPPTPRSLVSVKITGLAGGPIDALRSLLWKPASSYVTLDRTQPARLVADTAADGLPLRASAGVDYPRPFNLVPRANRIAVTSGQGDAIGTPAITYAFYTQALRPQP
jgi:hypothetical protein